MPRAPASRRPHRARRNVRLAALLGGLLTLIAVALSGGQATTDAVLACGGDYGALSSVVCPTPTTPAPTATNTPVLSITPVTAPTPTTAPCVCPTEVPPTATATTAPPPPPPTIAPPTATPTAVPPTATPTEEPCVCPTATSTPNVSITPVVAATPTTAPPTATATEAPCVCPTATPVPPTVTRTPLPTPAGEPPSTVVPSATPTTIPPPPPTITPPTPTTVPVFEGCTPGYWKQTQHFDSWTTYTQNQTVENVFDVPNALGLDDVTLLAALDGGGGPGLTGGAKILLRAGVAALLNSTSAGTDYQLTTTQVITQVNAALASNSRQAMLDLASTLDRYNNAGCDLS